MKLSTHIIRRVGRAVVLSLALAAIAVPASQAGTSAQSGGVEVHVFPLHGQAQSVPLVTDNSGRQAGTEARVFRLHGQAQSVPLVTDHSARRGYAVSRSDLLDPLIADAIRYSALRTSYSAGQAGTGGATSMPSNVVAKSTPGNGFDWRDAGIGAAGAFTLVALFAVTLAAIRRRVSIA
jgi:hypothetical protein